MNERTFNYSKISSLSCVRGFELLIITYPECIWKHRPNRCISITTKSSLVRYSSTISECSIFVDVLSETTSYYPCECRCRCRRRRDTIIIVNNLIGPFVLIVVVVVIVIVVGRCYHPKHYYHHRHNNDDITYCEPDRHRCDRMMTMGLYRLWCTIHTSCLNYCNNTTAYGVSL